MSLPIRQIKLPDRSKIGFCHSVTTGSRNIETPHANVTGLDIGAGEDFAVLFAINRFRNSKFDVVIGKAKFWTAGWQVECSSGIKFGLAMSDGTTVKSFNSTTNVQVFNERVCYFADRSANLEVYQDLNKVGEVDISSVENVDESNTEPFFMCYHRWQYKVSILPLTVIQFYNFGVNGLPSASDREKIVREFVDNPYIIPPTLRARPNHSTELRLWLDFQDVSPDSSTIPDKSAYNNNVDIYLNYTAKDVLREVLLP